METFPCVVAGVAMSSPRTLRQKGRPVQASPPDILAAAMEAPASRAGTLAGGVADTDAIRGRFPALERRENGVPVAYFDGPGGTQVPVNVVRAMADYLFKHNANT